MKKSDKEVLEFLNSEIKGNWNRFRYNLGIQAFECVIHANNIAIDLYYNPIISIDEVDVWDNKEWQMCSFEKARKIIKFHTKLDKLNKFK